jgi:UPF0271 protein
MKADLNCDLGEGEPLRQTAALMRWITSANIACGGHAGDLASMTACVRLAKEHGVHIGAHPGAEGGRGEVQITPDELELLLLQQIGTLERVAQSNVHHVKLHGALYHLTDANAALARRYIQAIKQWRPKLIIYARAGGLTANLARRQRVRVWDEGFADRRYAPDGRLVPRTEPNALITEPKEALTQAQRLKVRTICVHSDTPGSVTLVREISKWLRN